MNFKKPLQTCIFFAVTFLNSFSWANLSDIGDVNSFEVFDSTRRDLHDNKISFAEAYVVIVDHLGILIPMLSEEIRNSSTLGGPGVFPGVNIELGFLKGHMGQPEEIPKDTILGFSNGSVPGAPIEIPKVLDLIYHGKISLETGAEMILEDTL